MEETLARIAAYEKVQPAVWIERFPDEVLLARAKAMDPGLPLAGLTFAVKDNIDVAGLPTTAACPAYAYRPERSATVVERLEAAGAICVGKTNLDQFATGLVGTRSPYGAPGCVFNRAYISGGSSSGSAVATAAGLADFALGTDTAGSGRVPAAFNHLVGFKPTRGRWSARGVVPACQSLDTVSVFAKSVGLAARVSSVLTAFDAADPYSRHPGRPEGTIRDDGGKFVFGVPKPEQLNFLGDSQSAALYAAAVARMAEAGGEPIEIDIEPLLECARLLYAGPWVAERTAAVGDLIRSNPGAVHPVVRGIIAGGNAVSAVEAFKGLHRLAALQRAAETMWLKIDTLVLPTAPTTYRIAEVLAEPVALNANLGLYTNFVNLLDMSAVAVPAGFRDNGTGFGVTLIGPAWADEALLALAGRYEAVSSFEVPPLDLGERVEGIKLAVVGAHLSGMPLHWQLTSREARLVKRCRTAPAYRLYAMTNTTPLKPALVHVGEGAAIEVEVYELGALAFGSFTAEVPPPLAIGTVTLDDGSQVKGFVAEPRAMDGADDVSHLGGWRAYIASRS